MSGGSGAGALLVARGRAHLHSFPAPTPDLPLHCRDGRTPELDAGNTTCACRICMCHTVFFSGRAGGGRVLSPSSAPIHSLTAVSHPLAQLLRRLSVARLCAACLPRTASLNPRAPKRLRRLRGGGVHGGGEGVSGGTLAHAACLVVALVRAAVLLCACACMYTEGWPGVWAVTRMC